MMAEKEGCPFFIQNNKYCQLELLWRKWNVPNLIFAKLKVPI